MDKKTIRALCDITSAFYRENADSFSATRRGAWGGWRECLDAAASALGVSLSPSGGECADAQALGSGALAAAAPAVPSGSGSASPRALSLLDVACGNLRFEGFLREACPHIDWRFYGVDSCDELVRGTRFELAGFQRLDIVSALAGACEGAAPGSFIDAPACDMAVCFGFFHHVPTFELRCALLRAIVGKLRPGGVAMISFWQFLNSPDLAARARDTHERACRELSLPGLDEGDYLLGWQNRPGSYRYCHHFSPREVESLLSCVADMARPCARFEADGRTGNLNAYVVLQREGGK